MGFGNRRTVRIYQNIIFQQDTISYRAVGIDLRKIFLVDKKGNVKNYFEREFITYEYIAKNIKNWLEDISLEHNLVRWDFVRA